MLSKLQQDDSGLVNEKKQSNTNNDDETLISKTKLLIGNAKFDHDDVLNVLIDLAANEKITNELT